MGTRRQSIKLPTDLVAQIQKIKDKRVRNAWRKQFKNDYGLKEMCEEFIEEESKPMLENSNKFIDELERKGYAHRRKLVPKWEKQLKDIKERISIYQEGLKDYLNGDEIDTSRYCLVFYR